LRFRSWLDGRPVFLKQKHTEGDNMNDDPNRFPPTLIIEQDHTEWVDDDSPIDLGYKHQECACYACIGGLILLIILGLIILFMLPDIVKWLWG